MKEQISYQEEVRALMHYWEEEPQVVVLSTVISALDPPVQELLCQWVPSGAAQVPIIVEVFMPGHHCYGPHNFRVRYMIPHPAQEQVLSAIVFAVLMTDYNLAIDNCFE